MDFIFFQRNVSSTISELK